MPGSADRGHALGRTRRGPCRCARWPLVLSGLPLHRLQKVFALLLLTGSALLCAFVALFGDNIGSRLSLHSSWVKPLSFEWNAPSKREDEEDSWRASLTEPPSWRAEFLGKANLHVFEEWCGTSINSLRNNVHFPLHPHVRTTVKALAVAPQQINYGLRIFGYLHPPVDGDYEFAVSSDDNSEMWLSSDSSPLNLQLCSWVGKSGGDWTAPGEFGKFLHQKSIPIRLSAQTRYFFEVLLKQNDKGTDHIIVAWRRLDQAEDFAVIRSEHISLYVDESSLVLGDIDHIPQTIASHEQSHSRKSTSAPDMQREDPRDTFYKVPLINSTLLNGLLPDCVYRPSYKIKGSRLSRYQGLNHVHLSYIYPNDHTRLTHLDTETTCFYPIKPHSFHRYMVKDREKPSEQKDPAGKNEELRNEISEGDEVIFRGRRSLSLDNANWTNHEAFPRPVTKKQLKLKRKTVVKRKPKVKLKGKITEVDPLPVGVNKMSSWQVISKRTIQQNSAENEINFDDVELLNPEQNIKDDLELNKPLDFGDNSLDPWDWKERDIQSMPLQENPFVKAKWAQTFTINNFGYQGQRSHALNMDCRLTGNIQVQEAEVKIVVEAFMDKFNQKHKGWNLERVVNVVMNADVHIGKRYLLELELRNETGALLQLSQYIYVLLSHKPDNQPKLCNPVGFRWTPEATVHFVIPVKNQARWVHLLIKDVEKLAKETKDPNFNLILSDFSSTDMNIEEALSKSSIPRYQYKKLTGNFERSRGLQEGINLIEDPHSIVFLFDLHIRFPSSILDLSRKHCVEGHQAFAPIVLRLDCGASPLDARGLWEVQGFGLLGIYKSDLDRIGGMNTREFKFKWGGEDWELLDRILVGGLEVERFYMRNFYHHYHSKRGMWTSSLH